MRPTLTRAKHTTVRVFFENIFQSYQNILETKGSLQMKEKILECTGEASTTTASTA